MSSSYPRSVYFVFNMELSEAFMAIVFYLVGLIISSISIGIMNHSSPVGFLVLGIGLIVAPLFIKDEDGYE